MHTIAGILFAFCRINKLLGKGFFASVHEGVWEMGGNNRIKVAVKILRENTELKCKVRFLREAAIMGQFCHPHIIKLHGVILENTQLNQPCVSMC